MYCPKCGTELPEEMKFCFNCGEKVDIGDGARKETNNEGKFSNKSLTSNSEPNKSIWSGVSKMQTDFSSIQSETWGSKCRKRIADFWSRRDGFTKAIIIGSVICSLLCMFSFLTGRMISAIYSLVQVSLLISAWLMHRQIIKTEKKWLPILLAVLAYLLIFPYFGLLRFEVDNASPSLTRNTDSADKTDNAEKTKAMETFLWPESELAARLPVPESNLGYIQKETAEELSICLTDVTRADYDDYIIACAEKGFDMLVSREKDSYCVDNKGGYRVTLSYLEDSKMIIAIKASPFPVEIELNCTANLLFSKYDVEIYIDRDKIGTLAHGSLDTFKVELDKGAHDLEIRKKGTPSVSGELKFEVMDTIRLSCEINCYSERVAIEEKYIESLSPLPEGMAKIPTSSSDYKSQTYEAVLAELSNAGFSNISANEIQDLEGGWLDIDGEIEEVSIDGKTEFRKAEIYDKDVEIIITYHTLASEAVEPTDSEEESGSEDADTERDEVINAVMEKLNPYLNGPVAEVMPLLAELGYTATYTAENTGMDFTYAIEHDEPTREVFVISGFQKIDSEACTIEVMVLGKDTISDREKQASIEDILENTLDEYTAWIAVEEYGKTQYSDFKLHYILGKLSAEAEDENTWFLKALCDVKTENGKQKNLNCEARVEGTDDNPVVTYFIVY